MNGMLKEEMIMKKTIRFMLYAVAAIATVSCAEEIIPENTQEGNASELDLIHMTFSAGAEDTDTKVVLQEDRKTIHWEATDKIKVFDGTCNDLPAFTTTGSGLSVDFTGGVADAEAGTYYALYPYQADATYGPSAQTKYGNVIQAVVPPVQTAVPDGIHSEAFVAAAKSENGNGNFRFKTICGFVKFQLSAEDAENAVAVSLSGNDLGALAGSVDIYFQTDDKEEFGQTYVSNKNTDYVTLTGTFLPDRDYYFAIRSNNFAEGFTITILYADGTCKHITTTKAPSKKVARNSVMNIGKPAFKPGLPNDLYIAWQHGLSIDIAGEKLNKKDNPETVTLLKKTGEGIGKNGIFFIDPAITDVKLTSGGFSKLMICGRYQNSRSKFNNNARRLTWVPSDDKEYIVLKNIEYVNSEGYDDRICTHNKNGQVKLLAFDNCSFTLPNGKAFDYINPSRKYGKMIMNGCDFKLATGSKSVLFSFGGDNTETLPEFVFTNNIVYSPDGDHKEFKIFNAAKAQLTKLIVKNNIFYQTYCSANGYAYTIKNEYYDMQNNIFYIPNYGTYAVDSNGKAQWWGFLRAATAEFTYYPSKGNVTVANNYAYKLNGNNFKATHLDLKEGSTYWEGVRNPDNAAVDPFEEKDLNTPKFTLKAEYAKYIGATR